MLLSANVPFVSRSTTSDESSITTLHEALDLLENPQARYHVRQAIQLEMAEHER